MEITKDTQISEILRYREDLIEDLLQLGLGCVGCPMAQMETIEQGLKAHGASDKEVEEVIKKLNNKTQDKSSEQTKEKDQGDKPKKEEKTIK